MTYITNSYASHAYQLFIVVLSLHHLKYLPRINTSKSKIPLFICD